MSTPPASGDDDAVHGDDAAHRDDAPARSDSAADGGSPPSDDAARDDDHARAEALFRYGVIAPLLDEREDGSLRARITTLARERHLHPRRGEIAISGSTLWTWRSRFRRGGIDALRPRHRKDRGSLRAVPRDILARAELLRRQVPKRWTTTVIDILVREGTIDAAKRPHRATVDRHLRRRGASRRQLLVLGAKPTIKMQFAAFGDLWVGDYHHGPKVLAPDGRLTTAKLGAFIDHTTRYPVADRWYLAEDLGSLRDTMLRAVLVWGPPRLAYTDRGAVYRRSETRRPDAAWRVRSAFEVLVARGFVAGGVSRIVVGERHDDGAPAAVRSPSAVSVTACTISRCAAMVVAQDAAKAFATRDRCSGIGVLCQMSIVTLP